MFMSIDGIEVCYIYSESVLVLDTNVRMFNYVLNNFTVKCVYWCEKILSQIIFYLIIFMMLCMVPRNE